MQVSVHDEEWVQIGGGMEALGLLSQNINHLVRNRWNHMHIEYYPGVEYIAETAVPLIFQCIADSPGGEEKAP